MHPALTPCSATMVAFALTASTATLFRRTSILPATTSVRAFPPCAVGSVRRRSSAPASWGATTVRAMAESIKAPASVTLSDEEWRTKLSPEQFHILRQKGTEMGGTGEYNKFQPPAGFFKCAACENPLYSAESKFNSGCGWPAFDKCYKDAVTTKTDMSFGMKRVEIMCNACGGHLGHVFEGERFTATNERHCVNSYVLMVVLGESWSATGLLHWRPDSDVLRTECEHQVRQGHSAGCGRGQGRLSSVTNGSIWKRRLCSSPSMLPLAGDIIGSAEAGLVVLYLGRAQVSVFSVAHLLAALFHSLIVCPLSFVIHGVRDRYHSVAAAKSQGPPHEARSSQPLPGGCGGRLRSKVLTQTRLTPGDLSVPDVRCRPRLQALMDSAGIHGRRQPPPVAAGQFDIHQIPC